MPYSYSPSGDVIFLLGEEVNGYWGEFGGGVEKGETITECAAREFVEESMGFFTQDDFYGKDKVIPNYTPSTKSIVTNNITLYTLEDKTAVSYIYLLEIAFNKNLPYYFSNVLANFTKCVTETNEWGVPVIPSCPDGYIEKTSIGWYTLDAMRSNLEALTFAMQVLTPLLVDHEF